MAPDCFWSRKTQDARCKMRNAIGPPMISPPIKLQAGPWGRVPWIVRFRDSPSSRKMNPADGPSRTPDYFTHHK